MQRLYLQMVDVVGAKRAEQVTIWTEVKSIFKVGARRACLTVGAIKHKDCVAWKGMEFLLIE